MSDNVTTDDLETALQQLADEMGLSTVEYVQSLGYATVADVAADVTNLQSQITAIVELDGEDGVESLAEKVQAINDVLSDENGVIQAIYTKIQENATAIADETTRATGVEADLQSQINNISGGATGSSTDFEERLSDVEQAVEDAKAYSDANDLKAASMDICSIGNKFRQSLGLADNVCDSEDASGDDGEDGGDAVVI